MVAPPDPYCGPRNGPVVSWVRAVQQHGECVYVCMYVCINTVPISIRRPINFVMDDFLKFCQRITPVDKKNFFSIGTISLDQPTFRAKTWKKL